MNVFEVPTTYVRHKGRHKLCTGGFQTSRENIFNTYNIMNYIMQVSKKLVDKGKVGVNLISILK